MFNPFKRRHPKQLLKKKRCLADCKPGEPTNSAGNRRVIKTARTVETINKAAQNGFRPLVQPVLPSADVHFMVGIFQNQETGEIQVSGDSRDGYPPPDGSTLVMRYTTFYPYKFDNPFAAYLLPKELEAGEEVWLDDVIEDIVAAWGNQGFHPRLNAAPAIWTGETFEILFDPARDAGRWIG